MPKCREGQDVRERPHDQCEALAARPQSAISLNYRNASVVELVDTRDSKSRALKSVPVRVRPLVPNIKTPSLQRGGVFCLAPVVGEIGTPGSTNCACNLDAERSKL